MDLHSTFPGIPDLKRHARRRLPHFVWEYVESGTGAETTLTRNRKALDDVRLSPSILHGELEFDTSRTLLGCDYPLPFGIAPIGMSGLVWPDAERLLAQAAAEEGIPYALSTVASQSPEDLAPHLGPNAWFQLYPPRDPDIRKDMLGRAHQAGFRTLVLTVDVPVASRRERQTRSGLRQPPKLTPRLLAQIATKPAWAMGMLRNGVPHMRTLDKYIEDPGDLPPTAHIGYLLRTSPGLDYVSWLRDHWDGGFVVKGILRPEDSDRLERVGVDALWVSNHGGRQFDAAPASIEALPAIRDATNLPLIFDSGIESGLDVLRALSLGADFVMLGRAFLYGLAALGPCGPAHVIDVLRQDLHANMGQMGLAALSQIER
ncbi:MULTISPECIES: alpha-hydroxy acid oxidase [unclassified Ruegeria]|uniref:alpha-hydroxy acid oxidase n=1 Tax=unclassified Ruegeria TaxID=2625375 RepID=UPI00149247A6|nr:MULTISPECIES: alpha-hydroxy acid oxidase [unclassified Ruegeria]NOD34701.1 alpha-hydroxy-acid oxidizing protein [Ruegeria sp. HKCCD7296]NOE41829.1 alpha-hydroxy-acid oxidizing protein [Ruegeria sp. HKCCD7319]